MCDEPCIWRTLTRWQIIASLAVVVVLVIVVHLQLIDITVHFSDYACCNGQPCTDTYYSNETGDCVLTLCESNPMITDKSECHYPSAINGVA